MTVRPARGAATVDGRPARIKVDQHPPARQAVRALAQFDIADHGDQPPIEVIDGDIALRHLVALGQRDPRSEEHTSELQSLMRISYAAYCLKKKTPPQTYN